MLTLFVLYVAKPVALAILVAVVLIPIVALTQRRWLGRIPSVLITLLPAVGIVGGVEWAVVAQTNSLIRVPAAHKEEIKDKVDQLRGTGGAFADLLRMVNEIIRDSHERPASPTREVVVAKPDEGPPITRLITPSLFILKPMTLAGVFPVLELFVLIGREDLRHRLPALLGRGRLVGPVRGLRDSPQRDGQSVLFQLIVNATVGILFSLGLVVIAVPHALLWGFLTAVLRFILYVGAVVWSLFPMTLTFATFPGWQNTFLVLGYLVVLNLFVSNVVEPLLFGHHPGVFPIALLISAFFRTWIRGPIGLVLATPLTVCLVVMGQHISRPRPLGLVLGDQPGLEPHVEFYLRLVAKDVAGACQLATAAVNTGGPARSYDEVEIPSLVLARRDRRSGGLPSEEERQVYGTVRTVIKNFCNATPTPRLRPAAHGPKVLGLPAHDALDELPVAIIAEVPGQEGRRSEVLDASLLPAQVEQRVADTGSGAVVISIMPPGGLAQAGRLCRRLRKRFPELHILPIRLGEEPEYDQTLVPLRMQWAIYLTTSIAQTCAQVRASLLTPSPAAGQLYDDPSEKARS